LNKIIWTFILLGMVLLTGGCSLFTRDLLYKAGENTAGNFIQKIMASEKKERIKHLGIIAMEADSPEGFMRDSLHNAFSAVPGIIMVGMDEMKEKMAAIGVLGNQVKYQKYYDASSLVEIGRMTGVQTLVTGRIISLRKGLRSVEISFQGQVLDLEKGEILFSGSADGNYYRPVSHAEIGMDALLLILMALVMAGLPYLDYFCGDESAPRFRRKTARGVLLFTTAAGFVAYYLVLA